MSFSNLLSRISMLASASALADAELVKSMAADGDDDGADDAAIAAAAEGGETVGDETTADADAADDEGAGEEEGFGKSFQFTTEDGEHVNAIDATDLLKSLVARFDETESQTVEALTGIADLLKSQRDEISLLKSQVASMATTGRGRRTVLAITEKGETLQKSMPEEPAGVSTQEFMAKATAAYTNGAISGQDLNRCEAYVNRGMAPPADITNKVLGG